MSRSSFRAEIECDNLNGSMYSFKGLMRKIRWNAGATTASVDTDVEPDGSGYSIPDEVVLETSNLLLRSSSLKAPDFIYGAVVHTGLLFQSRARRVREQIHTYTLFRCASHNDHSKWKSTIERPRMYTYPLPLTKLTIEFIVVSICRPRHQGDAQCPGCAKQA